MTDTVRTRTIAAESRAVWDVLADFGSISRWADNVDHSCILEHGDSDGVLGTGRRIQTGRTVVVERILEYEPGTSLAYDIEGLPARLRTVRNRLTLERLGAGATAVTITSTVEIGQRPPHKVAERVVGRMLGKQSDTMLGGLAAHVAGTTLERRHD